MEHDPDPLPELDSLIRESLHEQLGPPPGPELWARIAHEIQQPAPPDPRPWWEPLVTLVRIPLVQSALVLALLVLLIAPPAYEVSRLLPDPDVPTRLPHHTPQGRPVPRADLLPSEEGQAKVHSPAGTRLPKSWIALAEAP